MFQKLGLDGIQTIQWKRRQRLAQRVWTGEPSDNFGNIRTAPVCAVFSEAFRIGKRAGSQ